jgi:tight adherence protein C
MSVFAAGIAALIVLTLGAALRERTCGPIRSAGTADARPATPLRSRWALVFAAVIAGLVISLVLGPLPLLAGATSALIIRLTRPALIARRERGAISRAIPDAIDLLVLSVRAGLTPQQAVRELAGTAPDAVAPAFSSVVHRTDRGHPFADALAALSETLGAPALGMVDVLATGERYGLAVGPMLDQLSIEARATRRRLDEADARRLPVRLSFPLVTCTLPSFVLLAIAPAVIAALSSLGSPAW